MGRGKGELRRVRQHVAGGGADNDRRQVTRPLGVHRQHIARGPDKGELLAG